MVKGVSRRVIVVKSPDPRVFEEAIFLVKEDTAKKGVTQQEVLRQAQSVANEYIKANSEKRCLPGLSRLSCGFIGAGAMGLLWMISAMIF